MFGNVILLYQARTEKRLKAN